MAGPGVRPVGFGIQQVRNLRLPQRLLSADVGQQVVYDSWGQLFDLGQLKEPTSAASSFAQLQQHITCWGSGQMNLQSASDENLRQLGIAMGRGGLYGRVIRERQKAERLDLAEVIQEAATNTEDTQLLQRTLRSNSSAWSVLVTSETTGGPAVMCVLESGFGNFAARHSTFSF